MGMHIAQLLSISYTDGDALHTPEAVEQMRQNIPLTDSDRIPWVRSRFVRWSKRSVPELQPDDPHHSSISESSSASDRMPSLSLRSRRMDASSPLRRSSTLTERFNAATVRTSPLFPSRPSESSPHHGKALFLSQPFRQASTTPSRTAFPPPSASTTSGRSSSGSTARRRFSRRG